MRVVRERVSCGGGRWAGNVRAGCPGCCGCCSIQSHLVKEVVVKVQQSLQHQHKQRQRENPQASSAELSRSADDGKLAGAPAMPVSHFVCCCSAVHEQRQQQQHAAELLQWQRHFQVVWRAELGRTGVPRRTVRRECDETLCLTGYCLSSCIVDDVGHVSGWKASKCTLLGHTV